MSHPHKKPKLSPPSSVHNPDSEAPKSSSSTLNDDVIQPMNTRQDSESDACTDTSMENGAPSSSSGSSSSENGANKAAQNVQASDSQPDSGSGMDTSPENDTSSESQSSESTSSKEENAQDRDSAAMADNSSSADRSSPRNSSSTTSENTSTSGSSSKKENVNSPRLSNVQTNGISQHEDERGRDDDTEMKYAAGSPSASSSDCSSSSSSSSYDSKVLGLTCKWRRSSYSLKVHGSTTIGEMKLLLCQFTHVLPKRMKIVGLKQKGGNLLSDSATVSNLDLKAKKFMMIGTPEDSIWVDPSNLDPGSLPEVIDDLDYDFVPEELTEIQANPVNRKKLQKRIDSINVNIINAPRRGKRLLVLDLDYTLFDMKSKAPNFEQLKRPFTDEFLEAVYPEYDIVIWSQTSWRWLELKLTGLNILTHPRYRITFVLDRTAMFPIFNKKKKHEVKPLALIWAKFKGFYNESNTIHIDDVSRNFAMNPRSGLKIVPFKHAHQMRHTDRELVFLARYLVLIAGEKSFNKLEHSKWQQYLANHPDNY